MEGTTDPVGDRPRSGPTGVNHFELRNGSSAAKTSLCPHRRAVGPRLRLFTDARAALTVFRDAFAPYRRDRRAADRLLRSGQRNVSVLRTLARLGAAPTPSRRADPPAEGRRAAERSSSPAWPRPRPSCLRATPGAPDQCRVRPRARPARAGARGARRRPGGLPLTRGARRRPRQSPPARRTPSSRRLAEPSRLYARAAASDALQPWAGLPHRRQITDSPAGGDLPQAPYLRTLRVRLPGGCVDLGGGLARPTSTSRSPGPDTARPRAGCSRLGVALGFEPAGHRPTPACC